MIIIHHWGADGGSFDGTVNWLCNPYSKVSAHYVVKANKVCQLVDLSRKAWHCVGKNGTAIGIECRPEMSAADLKTVAELIANIWKIYGKKLPIYGHKDFNNTACPGRYYSKLKWLYNEAERIYNGGKPTQPLPAKVKLAVDGMIGRESTKALQRLVGTTVDGVISGQLSKYKKYVPAVYTMTWEGTGSPTIKALQKYLTKNKFSTTADGYMGSYTVRALQKFLNSKGEKLVVDGYLGVQTAKALQRFLNKN